MQVTIKRKNRHLCLMSIEYIGDYYENQRDFEYVKQAYPSLRRSFESIARELDIRIADLDNQLSDLCDDYFKIDPIHWVNELVILDFAKNLSHYFAGRECELSCEYLVCLSKYCIYRKAKAILWDNVATYRTAK